MTSLPLSQELWKLGLKINTEKRYYDVLFPNGSRKIFLSGGNRIEGCPNDFVSFEAYPTYSTDELLEVLPDRIEIERYNFNFYVYIPEYKHREKDIDLSEALGLMAKYLLEHGYTYDSEKKGIRKESK